MAITSGLSTPIRHPVAGNVFMNPKSAALTAGMSAKTFFHNNDDRFSFTRASTGTLLGQNGRIQTAAVDAFRFDYDVSDQTSLSSGGWLCERDKTNLLIRSEALGNAGAWTRTGCTITANTDTAPDGATTMDTIREDASTGVHGIEQAVAFVAGSRLAATCWADDINQDFLHIQVVFPGSTQEAWFDLANGTVGTVTGANAAVMQGPFRDGRFRCYLQTDAAGGETAATVHYNAADADNSTSYTGVTQDSILCWGCQAEVDHMTSYIPTPADVTVARAQDLPLISLVDLDPNHVDMHIVFDFLAIPNMDGQILTFMGTTIGANGESFAISKIALNELTINISDNTATIRFTSFDFNVGDFAPKCMVQVEWDNTRVGEDRVWMEENDTAMAFSSVAQPGTSTWTVMPDDFRLWDTSRETSMKLRELVFGA